MGSGILTRKARKRIFHDKIQQSSINFTRFGIDKRSNQSANKIIIVGIGKVTQFSIILSHRDKQATQHTSKQETGKRGKRERGEWKREGERKRGRIKWQGWSGGEENERQMANNVMRRIRVVMGTWYVLTWRRSPRQRREKSFLLPLEHCVGFPLKRKGWCSKAA